MLKSKLVASRVATGQTNEISYKAQPVARAIATKIKLIREKSIAASNFGGSSGIALMSKQFEEKQKAVRK